MKENYNKKLQKKNKFTHILYIYIYKLIYPGLIFP